MILNENYFDDLKLTDDDIESPDGIAISNNNEYATPEEWFMDIKSRYIHCIDIPLKRDVHWKVNPKLIIKRLFYVFDVYGIEYSEPTLQELINVENNLDNGYSQCNFINYNGYKFISSRHKTIEDVDNSSITISVVIFFNLPKDYSYKATCTFISSIIKCLLNDKIRDLHFKDFNVYNFESIADKRNITMFKNSMGVIDIISIIRIFFPEKGDIREELFADDHALLNKLLKCF